MNSEQSVKLKECLGIVSEFDIKLEIEKKIFNLEKENKYLDAQISDLEKNLSYLKERKIKNNRKISDIAKLANE